MKRIVYEQGEPERVEIDGISGRDLPDDLFASIAFYGNLDYSPNFKSSHTFEPNKIDSTSRDLNFPYELLYSPDSTFYVIKNGISNFYHERNILNLFGSPNKGRRVFFNFVRTKTRAKLIDCDEQDGESSEFRNIVMMEERGYINPFTIKKLDKIVTVKDDFVCEVDSDGFLFGKDISLFLEEGLATEYKHGFSVSEGYVTKVLDEIKLLRKGDLWRCISRGNDPGNLTGSFYREMNRKLDDIFRGERK